MKTSITAGILFLLFAAAIANQWTNRNPATHANRRDSHNMVYDTASKKLILYGGHASIWPACAACYSDTWVYDYGANTWTKMAPDTNPGARAEFGMAYDQAHDRVIFFGADASSWPGGTPGPNQNNDTWEYDVDGDAWANRNPSVKPPAVNNSRLAYDSESDKTITIAGGTTWAYDYTSNQWENKGVAGGPTNGFGLGMTYDGRHDRVMVMDRNMQLWAYNYNANQWAQRAQTGPRPSAPSTSGWVAWLAYDSESDRLIYLNDDVVTWAYDWTSNQWTNMNVAAMTAAHHHALAYLPDVDRVLFYAGPGQNQTWEYDYNTGTAAEAGPAVAQSIFKILPNPLSPSFISRFTSGDPSNAGLYFRDLLGRPRTPRNLPAGGYIVEWRADGVVQRQKMVVIP